MRGSCTKIIKRYFYNISSMCCHTRTGKQGLLLYPSCKLQGTLSALKVRFLVHPPKKKFIKKWEVSNVARFWPTLATEGRIGRNPLRLNSCTRFLAISPTAATDRNHTRVNGDTDTWNGNKLGWEFTTVSVEGSLAVPAQSQVASSLLAY